MSNTINEVSRTKSKSFRDLKVRFSIRIQTCKQRNTNLLLYFFKYLQQAIAGMRNAKLSWDRIDYFLEKNNNVRKSTLFHVCKFQCCYWFFHYKLKYPLLVNSAQLSEHRCGSVSIFCFFYSFCIFLLHDNARRRVFHAFIIQSKVQLSIFVEVYTYYNCV